MALVCPSIERLMAVAKRCALVKIGKGRRRRLRVVGVGQTVRP